MAEERSKKKIARAISVGEAVVGFYVGGEPFTEYISPPSEDARTKQTRAAVRSRVREIEEQLALLRLWLNEMERADR